MPLSQLRLLPSRQCPARDLLDMDLSLPSVLGASWAACFVCGLCVSDPPLGTSALMSQEDLGEGGPGGALLWLCLSSPCRSAQGCSAGTGTFGHLRTHLIPGDREQVSALGTGGHLCLGARSPFIHPRRHSAWEAFSQRAPTYAADTYNTAAGRGGAAWLSAGTK